MANRRHPAAPRPNVRDMVDVDNRCKEAVSIIERSVYSGDYAFGGFERSKR